MIDSEKKDEEIALLVQSGRVELFGILVNRYEEKMMRYAGKVLRDRDDIKDVVQDVFIKTYVNIKSFDTKRKFSSWLYSIAHNEIVNTFKKNKKKNFLPIFNLDTFFPQRFKNDHEKISQKIEQQEMEKLIDSCLIQLEDKYKEPIVLYYFEGFSYQEIADIMRLPTSTVGIRIKRAKQIMKSLLEKKNHGKQ